MARNYTKRAIETQQFNARFPKDLHARLVFVAAMKGVSLNSLIVEILSTSAPNSMVDLQYKPSPFVSGVIIK